MDPNRRVCGLQHPRDLHDSAETVSFCVSIFGIGRRGAVNRSQFDPVARQKVKADLRRYADER